MATPYIRYANQGATRSLPLSDRLISALGYLGDLGVTAEVFSGGQPSEGPNRVGSHRHDHGNASDVFFYKDGRKLDWANPQDRPIFEEIVRRGKAAGITGFGAGPGYMQAGSMHVGFGSPAVWGAGGKSDNAPDWLRSAFYGTPAPQAAPEQQQASITPPSPSSPAGGARAASEIQPMGSLAPQQGGGLLAETQPQSPFGGILGRVLGNNSPIPTDVASFATAKEPQSLGNRLARAGKIMDAFTPDPPRISGGMGDARASGDTLLKYLQSMKSKGRGIA